MYRVPIFCAAVSGLLGAVFAWAMYANFEMGPGAAPSGMELLSPMLFWGGIAAVIGFFLGILGSIVAQETKRNDQDSDRYQNLLKRFRKDRDGPPPQF